MKIHSLGLMLLALLVAPVYASASEPTPNPFDLYRDLVASVDAADTFKTVEAPVGAKVDYVPDGAESKTIDDVTYFVFNDTYYRPFYSGSDVVYIVAEKPESSGYFSIGNM